MSAEGFWERIALARRTGGDVTGQVGLLLERPDAAFAEWFAARTGELASAEMWDAGSLVQGWLGEDGFADVRAWVVIHGEAAFQAARIDPDTLADLYPQRTELDSPAMLRLRPLVAPASATQLPGEWTNISDDRAVWARYPRLAGFVDARRCR